MPTMHNSPKMPPTIPPIKAPFDDADANKSSVAVSVVVVAFSVTIGKVVNDVLVLAFVNSVGGNVNGGGVGGKKQ